MKIIYEYPPNIDKIRMFFDLHPGIVFTWGNILYNPDHGPVDKALMKHEETHERQQAKIGIEVWWTMYLTSADFRVSQEVEAYQNQYKAQKHHIKDRNQLDQFLRAIAKDLSGPMYGCILTFDQAMRAIQSPQPIVFALPDEVVLQ